ncbi:MAG: BspA family leucine-rich repeat surface protein, partial [Lachnospiraceae bacterium]|nr:BspA family leucine-rich repeat surface protein [Lachnospiraceae bacterium]
KDSSVHSGLDRGYVKNINIPISTIMENSTFKSGKTQKLNKNEYVRPHYNFIGWSKTETGSVEYKDEQEVTNLTIIANSTVDLYAVWEPKKYTVNVTVINGTASETTKQITYNTDGTFNLTPTVPTHLAMVECTNNQIGAVENNVLTINNITTDTTCTVTYKDAFTVLYSDGTFIINEPVSSRATNVTDHGIVEKQYLPMDETNSYVFTSTSVLWEKEQEQILNLEIGKEIFPTETSYWFYNCRNLSNMNFVNLSTSNVTKMIYMFSRTGINSQDIDIDLSDWDMSNVTDFRNMFEYLSPKNSLNLKIQGWKLTNLTSAELLFNYTGSSTSDVNINLSGWEMPKLNSAKHMFYYSGSKSKTYNLDLSSWETPLLNNMSNMFFCTALGASDWKIIGLDSLDTSNVISMVSTFYQTGKYGEFKLDISNWDVSKVEDMEMMFYEAGENSTTFDIDLSNWVTTNVTDFRMMIDAAGYRATTWSIGDLSNWDISNAKRMDSMFMSSGSYASKWSIGDLSNWDTSKVTNMSRMFDGAGSNATAVDSIGTFTIPAGCDVADFADYSPKFTGNLIFNGVPSDDTYMLLHVATDSNAKVYLIHTDTATDTFTDELITLYGPSGTSSKGNIYKASSDNLLTTNVTV